MNTHPHDDEEFWLTGPVPGVAVPFQPVAHSLLQVLRECREAVDALPENLLWERPLGLASPGFHLLHIAGVIDRMFTYAAGHPLSTNQFDKLAAEKSPDTRATIQSLLDALALQVQTAVSLLRLTDPATAGEIRTVGRKQLPSTVIGLLFHAGEHGMRHVGQLITTVRILAANGKSR